MRGGHEDVAGGSEPEVSLGLFYCAPPVSNLRFDGHNAAGRKRLTLGPASNKSGVEPSDEIERSEFGQRILELRLRHIRPLVQGGQADPSASVHLMKEAQCVARRK